MSSTTTTARRIATLHGEITFPCFMPVTTFGGKYPLDEVLRPYLARFAPALMVSHYYALSMEKQERPPHPLFIDSGGFASLFEGVQIKEYGELACIQTADGTELQPAEVLRFQEEHADIGATLDFLISPTMTEDEAERRQALTIKNALWAVKHRSNRDMRLFASLQAWDGESARRITGELAEHGFDGFALGGMVPRVRDPRVIFEIVDAVREVDSTRPLHMFGMGSPGLLRALFERGVDSADSSSFIQQTVNKRYLRPDKERFVPLEEIGQPSEVCECRVCQTFELDYLRLEGELNNLALALHNLATLNTIVGLRHVS
jgi:tRNA-guanine family transglycosylase